MRTRTLKCSDVVAHICDELDAKLSSARCREIKRHLSRCPNCSAYLDSMKKTVRLYSAYPDPKVPSRTRKKLLAVLKLED